MVQLGQSNLTCAWTKDHRLDVPVFIFQAGLRVVVKVTLGALTLVATTQVDALVTGSGRITKAGLVAKVSRHATTSIAV